jgi:hypothetical protein
MDVIIYYIVYLGIGLIMCISDYNKPSRPPYVKHPLGWLFGILLWPLAVFVKGKF